MSAPAYFGIINRSSRVLQQLENAGMRIEVGNDFKIYSAYRASQHDRSGLYPTFDIAQSYIDHRNGFWICGFDSSGTLVHTQAICLLDLTDTTLAQHLNDHSQKYITPDTTPDPDQTHFDGPQELNDISGRVAYQGDFWLKSRGLGGPRGNGATSLLTRLSLELMSLSWNPDHTFAFVPTRLAEKGVHLRYGFSHCELGSWIGPDEQITDEEYIIWMSQSEMARKLSKEVRPIGVSQPAAQRSVVALNSHG